jgi:integrase
LAHLEHIDSKKWRITVELGRNPKTGRRKRKYKTVKGTKKKAQKVMLEMIKKYEQGNFSEAENITVKEYLKKWLYEYKKNDVSKRTFIDYKTIISNHLIPYLGNLKLKRLEERHIIKYQNDKLENGRLDGKGGLSKRSVQYHHRVLSQALKHAVSPYKFIQKNPCRGVKAPYPKQPEIHPLSQQEANQLLDKFENEFSFYTIIYVALYTGLRRGELLALRWKDLDLDNNRLFIRRSVNEIRGEGLIYKDPKTEDSKRTVDFDEDVTALLKRYLKKQFRYYNKEEIVFLHEDGRKIRPDLLTKKFKRKIREMGKPKTRFHDLRHTHATWLLKLGENPKVVQERLGHHDVTITLKIYSHVVPSMQKSAVKKLKNHKI